MAIKCIICTKLPIEYSKSPVESLDEKLAVVFFLKKFLKYPIISNNEIFGTNENERQDDKTLLDKLLKNKDSPSDLIHFCSCCLPIIQEAKCLYKIVNELQGKLSILRKKVESKVVESFQIQAENVENDGTNLFETVRGKIYKETISLNQQAGSLPITSLPSSAPHPPLEGVNVVNEIKAEAPEVGTQLEDTEWYAPQFVNDASIGYRLQDPDGSNFTAVSNEVEVGMFYAYTMADERDGLPTDVNDVKPFENESSQECLENFGATASNGGVYQDSQRKYPRGGNQKSKISPVRTCTVCREVFDSPTAMRRHYSSVHLRGKFPCDACKRAFSRKDSLKRHTVNYCLKTPTSAAYSKIQAQNARQVNNSESAKNLEMNYNT